MIGFHACPDVVTEPCLSHLKPDEIRHRIDAHREAIKELEDKMNWHHKAIAQYHGYLNILQSPINFLPRERLREVFKQLMWSFVSEVIFPSSPSSFRSSRTRCTWLKVALVCRYWRSIAISYPELFSYYAGASNREPSHFLQKCLEYS